MNSKVTYIWDKRQSYLVWGALLVLLFYVFPRLYAKQSWEVDAYGPSIVYAERQWIGPTKRVVVTWLNRGPNSGWYAQAKDGDWYLFVREPQDNPEYERDILP